MKKILVMMVAVLLAVSFSHVSYAQKAEAPAEKFDDIKAGLLKRLDDRIKRLSEERACIAAAKNVEDLKKCRPARPAGPGGEGGPMPGGPGPKRPQPPAGQPPR